MRVLVVGGTGRIGSLAAAAARRAGHEAVSVAGHAPANAEGAVVVADIRDADAVRRAVNLAEAIIAAVGPRSNSLEDELAVEAGMRNLVGAARELGVTRIITLSGAAVDIAGDRKPLIDRVASTLVRRAAKHVVGAKQREYEVLAASGLDWTALRPPFVIDGAARGYRLDLRLRPGARVTRADVAQALVDQLSDARYVGLAPFVVPR